MVDALERPGIVAVSSLWSYIPDKEHSWVGLKIYEFIRDIHLWIQSIKRPELSVRGLVFAYRTDYARQVGIRTDIRRGGWLFSFTTQRIRKYIFYTQKKGTCSHGIWYHQR